VKSIQNPSAADHSALTKRSDSSVLGRRVRNALRRRYHQTLRTLGTKHRFTVELVDAPEKLGGVRVLACQSNRRTSFTSPRLYDQKLEVIRQPALETKVPDLHFLELQDVSVVGATMAVVRDGRLLHPELLYTKPNHDDKAADICQFADAGRRAVDFNAYTRFGGRPRVKLGIHLLKEHSANYYHWFFECLPRLLYFLQHRELTGVCDRFTILIEDNILAAGLDALRRLINFPCDIETVRRGELVSCEKLFYVSPFWYSLDNSKYRVDPYNDYAVDAQAVRSVREAFRSLLSTSLPTRRIFLPRAATQVRRISNAPEVEALMQQNGFEIIHPHRCSFAEQVEIFSRARVVVGASGAAFSNMVFMQPGTKAVIFSPKQLEVFNYYIFQQQADVAGVELAHLLAVPEKQAGFYVHDDFHVNCDDLQTLVTRLSTN
jgi:capsular polysaccharide biosynthesis protein